MVVPPMKRSVRPLFSILLLILFAAAILTCRTSLRRGFNSFQLESDAFIKQPPPPPPPPPAVPVVFNTTLIKFAEVEIGEAKSKQEIEQLLEGNFDSRGRYKTFSSWRRFNTHDEYRPTRSSASGRLPVSLRSPKFYRYWLQFRKVLHSWWRNKRFYSEIMSEMVALVKNPIDSYNNNNNNNNSGYSEGKRYSSCAVVGNSGILLKGEEYGDLIDGHEFVIRLNNARVGSFEHNVGSKTSISFVNSNILHLCARRPGCFCHPYGANVPMIMYICQPVHFLDYTLCNSSHKAPLLVTDPRFDVLCARIVKYYSVKRFVEETGKPIEQWGSSHDGSMFHYSSGMQAVMLALGICDKVSIFGFGKSVEAKHHYHTNQKAELRLHDYEAEYAFYRDLAERPQVIPFISNKFKIPLVIIYH